MGLDDILHQVCFSASGMADQLSVVCYLEHYV